MRIRNLFLGIFSLFMLFPLEGNLLRAQSDASKVMQQEYPKLMDIYGQRLEVQHAHYIFAVDISSSMQPYESVVKNNFEAFVKAIPDGDQVTLIRMAREDYTDFVGLFKCITLTPETRKSLVDVLYSPQFTFLRDGNPKNGSDGYTMSRKVLEAVNTVGSSELTFIYLLTDFEYWTSKNHFDKNKEDWDRLADLLSDSRKHSLCKYGLELNFNDPRLKQQAIFKDELDKVFGRIDYQAVSSAEVLSQWFNHTISNVMAAKMNSMLKRDWMALCDSLNPKIECKSENVFLLTDCFTTPLVTGLKATAEIPGTFFHPNEDISSFNSLGEDILLGKMVSPGKTLFPSFLSQDEVGATVSITLDSPIETEIKKLLSVWGEKDNGVIEFSYRESVKMPACRLWNSFIPLWVWLMLACVLIIAVASILYTVFLLKVKRSWVITVVEKNQEGRIHRINGDTDELPYSIGRNAVLAVRGADWVLVLTAKKCNPLFFWKKSGFYITLQEGTFAEIVDIYTKEVINTLSIGNETFLFSHRKPKAFSIQMSSHGIKYSVELN